jgi:hypothetical protein
MCAWAFGANGRRSPSAPPAAEAALLKDGIDAAARGVARGLQPIDDWRGQPPNNRLQVAISLLRRLEMRHASSRSVRSRSEGVVKAPSTPIAAPRFGAEAHTAGALYRRHARAGRHLHAALVLSPWRTAAEEVECTPRRRRRVLGPNDIPAKRRRAVGTDEPLFATDRVSIAGQPLAMGRGDDARRGAPRRRAPSHRDRAEPHPRHRDGAARPGYVRRRRPCCAAIPTRR